MTGFQTSLNLIAEIVDMYYPTGENEPTAAEKIDFFIEHGDDLGAYGEYLTEYLLGSKEITGHKKILHNVYVPYGNKTTEIDVVMIHEKGIFVFESKNFSGSIYGSVSENQWIQKIRGNEEYQFYNPVKQNDVHIGVLSNYLKIDSVALRSFIVFSERCELKSVPCSTEHFTIVKRDGLLRELLSVLSKTNTIFSSEQVDVIYNKLLPLTNVSESVKQEHIESVRTDLNNKYFK